MRRAPCRKVRYRDRIGAQLALAGLANGHGRHETRPKDERRAYRCPTCKGWHLTSMRLPGRPVTDTKEQR